MAVGGDRQLWMVTCRAGRRADSMAAAVATAVVAGSTAAADRTDHRTTRGNCYRNADDAGDVVDVVAALVAGLDGVVDIGTALAVVHDAAPDASGANGRDAVDRRRKRWRTISDRERDDCMVSFPYAIRFGLHRCCCCCGR